MSERTILEAAKAFVAVWVLLFYAGLLYVTWHFIAKYW